jgi:hypothetical protein
MNPQNECRTNSTDFGSRVWARVLKSRYNEVAEEPIPDRFVDLLKRIDVAEQDEWRHR